MNIPLDWVVIGPATILVAGALVALMVDAFVRRRTWLGSGIPAVAALLGAGAEQIRTGGPDDHGLALSLVILASALFVVIASNVMNFEFAMPPGEYHFLLLCAVSGGLLMVTARDLVTLVVSLELLALPSIALVGLRAGDRRGITAAWTFFLASVVSTAVTLMGVSLLYGGYGSLAYVDFGLPLPGVPGSVMSAAAALTLIGLLFKLGAVPFHVWIPDTYRGAPVLVAGFLSTVSKAAALGAILVLLTAFAPLEATWQPIVAVVAAVTMTVGNLGALRQDDVVAMLAWSSVAQAGFLLAPAVAVMTSDGLWAPLQYLAVYALANLVAFAALAIVVRLRGNTSLEDMTGLARTDPWLGGSLAFAALTLAGMPPAVIGLVTKFAVIRPVVDGDHIWLAVVMAVNIMLGLAYYLRLVVALCDRPGGDAYVSPSPPFSVRIVKTFVVLGALALAVLSVWPAFLLDHVP